MNSNKSKLIAKLFAFLLVASVFASCNRGGTGCPNNFKASKVSTSITK